MIDQATIPAALKRFPQWVLWRYRPRGPDRKPDKQPVNPRTLANAGVSWPNTWTSFAYASAAYRRHSHRGLAGLGFVLTRDDPIVAIDIDECIHAGELAPHAQQVIETVASYTEISPSGRGLRILVACPVFQDNFRKSTMETYSHSRYVTITGHHLTGTPSHVANLDPTQLTSLLPSSLPSPALVSAAAQQTKADQLDDTALWEHIFAHDRFGAQHYRRYQGDLSHDLAGNRPDHSLAVMRLLNALARWTGCDAVRMRRMMLTAPLVNAKWFERRGGGDWLDYQIADAIAYVSRRTRR